MTAEQLPTTGQATGPTRRPRNADRTLEKNNLPVTYLGPQSNSAVPCHHWALHLHRQSAAVHVLLPPAAELVGSSIFSLPVFIHNLMLRYDIVCS